jgi:hypothetical protein
VAIKIAREATGVREKGSQGWAGSVWPTQTRASGFSPARWAGWAGWPIGPDG